MNEKNKVEAVLFSSGKRMSIEDISKLAGVRDLDRIKSVLIELKADYEDKGGSLSLFEDAGKWKLNVKDHYQSIVQKIVSQTELDRPLMETLAVIAWKFPVLQAEVIKIRHNKAYEHMKRLEEDGFITRFRFGRTKKITLTDKFFQYFDLPSQEQTRELFKQQVPEEVRNKLEKDEKEIDEGEKKIFDAKKKKQEMKKAKKEAEKKEKEEKKDVADVEKEVKQAAEEIDELEKEVKDVNSKMPSMQTQNEVSSNEEKFDGE